MKRRSGVSLGVISLTLGGVALLVIGASNPEGTLVRYSIVDLGTLGGFSSVALEINERGQVVGSADNLQGNRHAYLWEKGVMTDLGTLPGVRASEAWGINNLGTVVGIATNTGDIRDAFIWENGEMTELGDPDITKSALDINDAGQIVGQAFLPGGVGAVAFLYENGTLIDLTSQGFCGGFASDINQKGDIPGHGCLWQDGQAIPLGSLGGTQTDPLDLNDQREVVGVATRADGSHRAFHWQNGTITELPQLANWVSSEAQANNNRGQIVGAGTILVSTAGTVTQGFLYDPVHGMMDLLSTLPPDSGWSDLSPRGMNDAGQIVGAGSTLGTRHAFLMNPQPPIPALSPWGLFALALALTAAGAAILRRSKPRAH